MNKMKKQTIAIMILSALCLILAVALVGVGYGYAKEKERLEQAPYFTEQKADIRVLKYVSSYYWFNIEIDWEDVPYEDTWPDFSYYKLVPTENTEKVIAILNHVLFVDSDEYFEWSREYALECGLSAKNPITVEWVRENPVDAANIVINGPNGSFSSEKDLDDRYQSIIAEELSETETSVE